MSKNIKNKEKIIDSFYDAAFNNDITIIKDICLQYDLIPDIFNDMDEFLMLIVSIIEECEDVIIHLIQQPTFNLSHNNYEYILTISDCSFKGKLKYFSLLKRSVLLPCIYKEINFDLISEVEKNLEFFNAESKELNFLRSLKNQINILNF